VYNHSEGYPKGIRRVSEGYPKGIRRVSEGDIGVFKGAANVHPGIFGGGFGAVTQTRSIFDVNVEGVIQSGWDCACRLLAATCLLLARGRGGLILTA